MKHLVGKIITEKVDFMGEKIDVKKLSVGQVLQVQKLSKKVANNKASEEESIRLLRDVVRMAVVGAEELTDEEFDTFPLEELNKISNAVLKLSGVNAQGN
jgi:hypothetical protein